MREQPQATGGSGFGKSKRTTKGYPDKKVMSGYAQNGPAQRAEATSKGWRHYKGRIKTWNGATERYDDRDNKYINEYADYVKMLSNARKASIGQAKRVEETKKSAKNSGARKLSGKARQRAAQRRAAKRRK